MKRFIINALLGLSCCSLAMAKPSDIYQIFGPITNVPTVNSTVFYNQSSFDLTTALAVTNFNNAVGSGFNAIPYSTFNTLYFTNTTSGTMTGVPGFVFDTVTSTSRRPARSFVNDGSIVGFDLPAFPNILSTTAGTVAVVADSQPLAAHVEVDATNIINDGTMAVGNYGLLQLNGQNINNANGVLIAGAASTGGGNGFSFDSLDQTGGTFSTFFTDDKYYVNPAGVYDLFWGITNTDVLHVDSFDPPFVTTYIDGNRLGFNGVIGNFNTSYASYAYTYTSDSSNTYFNVVFVNTNFTDIDGTPNTNISVNVEFGGWEALNTRIGDVNGQSAMVEFSLPVKDVISGQVVSNTIYFTDIGAIADAGHAFIEYDNAGSADGYMRPSPFAVTTTPPAFWPGQQANDIFTNTLIFAPNTFSAKTVGFEAASYGVQIGRNPAQLDGGFAFTDTVSLGTNNFFGITGSLIGFGNDIALPDPTNEPARIELNAKNLDISNSRLRAEGMVIINTSNLVGQFAGSDWGEANTQIGATNGTLIVSNLYPTSFQRLRGDIYATAYTFNNNVTNSPSGPFTNTFHYHILVIDQNLGGNFRPAVRNLKLSAANSIIIHDSMYVINQSYFNTTNLTFDSNIVFAQNALDLTPVNLPNLKNFLNTTNANLSIGGTLDMGFDVTKAPASPLKRKYTVLSVTNMGTITATAPLFQSMLFENDGVIMASNNGSMIIEAASLGLGLNSLGSTNLIPSTNYLIADQNITLSAVNMGFTNSVIVAGGVNTNGRGLLTLQTTAAGQITDFVPGLPGTNIYNTNIWQVSDGLSLPVKPATGDLFGTEIISIANNFTVSLHTWGAADLGASSAGFSDNMVIGHLKLSRDTNSAFHFTGVGSQSAMYVDFLELDANTAAYTNYRSGITIDPNLTIYFAACNADPLKLEAAYPNRLVWVSSFAGPNSSVAVPYLGSTNICLLNEDLADSPVISFFGGVANADNQPYVLNNPTNAADVFPCPSDDAVFKDYVIGTNASTAVRVEISFNGKGTVTPNLRPSQLALGKKYTLVAAPAAGWVFTKWTASGLPAGLDLTSPVIKFTLEHDLILTANFSPRAFTLVKGTYHGLFAATNAEAAPGNSGSFTFTVGANGSASGKLLIGSTVYTFSTKFGTNGSAQAVAKHGGQTVAVTLQLDMTGESGRVTGYVNQPLIQLAGDLAAGWTAKNPSPFAGQFTLALTNSATNRGPAGTSYASLNVSKLGVATVSGKLADGNPFSQSVPVSKNGAWPFYYSGNGGDFLIGWVGFQASEVSGPSIGDTNVVWSKAASAKSRYYPGGFTNSVKLISSPYANPGKNASGLRLGDPVVVLSGGDLVHPTTISVANNGKLMYSTNNLTLSINPATGTFAGTLKDTGESTVRINGVVLQNQDNAMGFFLGASGESDAVLLQSR